MTAEVQGTTVPDKYIFFTGVTLGAVLMVLLFNLLFPDPLFFLFCAFVITFLLYRYVLQDKSKLFWVPIILSLVSYSLNYRALNETPSAITNHAVTTLVGMLVVLGALVLFPLSFYYRIWLRTFYRVVDLCLKNFILLQKGESTVTDIPAYIIQMRMHAHLLPRSYPTYSILNMTFNIHKLYLASCVYWAPQPLFTKKELGEIVTFLQQFLQAVEQEKPCQIAESKQTLSLETLRTEGDRPLNCHQSLKKIMHSWNYCVAHI